MRISWRLVEVLNFSILNYTILQTTTPLALRLMLGYLVQSHLWVAVFAPLVVLLVKLLGKRDVGDDDGVQSTGSVARLGVAITTRVVLVLAAVFALPGHAVLGNVDESLGGGIGRVAAYKKGERQHEVLTKM